MLFADRGKLEVRLGDSDVASTKALEAATLFGGGVLGPHFCAPELFNNQWSEKVDLWSIGVILFLLLNGSLPFAGDNHEQVVQNIVNGKVKAMNEGAS